MCLHFAVLASRVTTPWYPGLCWFWQTLHHFVNCALLSYMPFLVLERGSPLYVASAAYFQLVLMALSGGALALCVAGRLHHRVRSNCCGHVYH